MIEFPSNGRDDRSEYHIDETPDTGLPYGDDPADHGITSPFVPEEEPGLPPEGGEVSIFRVPEGYDTRRQNILGQEQSITAAKVDRVTADAYAQWAHFKGMEPDRLRTAERAEGFNVVQLVRATLRYAYDVPTKLWEYMPRGTEGRHYFLETPTRPDLGPGMLIDPTWKHIMRFWNSNPQYENEPDALIVPVRNLEKGFTENGIPEISHWTWTDNVRELPDSHMPILDDRLLTVLTNLRAEHSKR